MAKKYIRLCLEKNQMSLAKEIEIQGNDFDYLVKVMRQKQGDKLAIFNGSDGEFVAEIIEISKKNLRLKIIEKIAPLVQVPNISLAFALVKNVRLDFIAQKAVELGVSKLYPMLTQHTIVDKINEERFRANVKEALEQCERNDFPQILPLQKLDKILADDSNKIFILCDESHQGSKAEIILKKLAQNPEIKTTELVILIGPEGGFSETEFGRMRQKNNLVSMSLGPRILRADTAIISALTLAQEFLGDF